MKTIYNIILEQLKNRTFSFDDYNSLVQDIIINYFAHENNGEPIPKDYFELRNWVYDKIDNQVIDESFCIGATFGLLQIFDELTYNRIFQERRIMNV